jgi:hypothetical protein
MLCTPLLPAQEKLRVFVAGTGSRAESINHLNKRCPELTVTLDQEKAAYIIVHDDTGAGPGRKPQKVAVSNREGDVIYSGATRSIGNAMKDACNAIRTDVKKEKK